MHALQSLIEDAGFETRSYSGRGMYGKYCLGVTIGRDCDLGEFISGLLVYALENASDVPEQKIEAASALSHMSTDSMGRGQILYFPGVPYEGSGKSSEDGNEDDEDEG